MKKPESTSTEYIPQFCDFPASEAGKRPELFNILRRHVNNQYNILVNGKQFTSNIIDPTKDQFPAGTEIQERNGKYYIILPEGFDGVVLDYKKMNSSIIIPTADCASVSFTNEKIQKMGVLHAGYKGTAAGIVDNLFKHFKEYENFAKETHFDLSPMAGDDFELDTPYYASLFVPYLSQLGIDPFDKNFYQENWSKCRFSLSKILIAVLLAHGVPMAHINVSPIQTTDPTNNYYSYRLYSNFKDILNAIQDDKFELLPPDEKYIPPQTDTNYHEALVENPNPKVNSLNGRMATIHKVNK